MIGLIVSYISPYIHPTNLWIIPFFGLAYPVLMIIGLTIFILMLIFKSKSWIYVGLILLPGLLFSLRFVALGKPSTKVNDSKSIKVMSYNVQLFGLYNKELNNKIQYRDSIFNFLQRENPDVICFQEFYHKERPTTFITRDTISKFLGTKFYHEKYSHNIIRRKNFGIAMLSKHEMISKGDVAFIENNIINDDNYCIYADIIKNQDTFRIYNIHFQSIKIKKDVSDAFDENSTKSKLKKNILEIVVNKLKIAFPARANQALTVMEHIASSPYPVIICGDFNDTPMSFTYNQFHSKYTDAFLNSAPFGFGKTFVGKIPAGRIDYIFHSKTLNSFDFKVQEEVFSDHRAVSCKLYKQ